MSLQSIFLKLILALTASMFVGATLAGAVEPPLILKPSSKWEVNYKDDSCRLARRFGEGDDTVVVMFDKYKPVMYFWMTLVGKPLDIKNEYRALNVHFGSNVSKQKMPFYTGTLNDDLPAIFIRNAALIVPATEEIWEPYLNADSQGRRDIDMLVKKREDMVTSIELAKPLRRSVVLETGPLRPALNALEKCTEELLSHWGIDVEKHTNLKRAATPIYPTGEWFSESDYPSSMLEKGARSIIHFRLNVNEKGMPTACHIQHSNRLKEFDEVVCKVLMKRARFEPALEADGTPIASYHADNIRFHM